MRLSLTAITSRSSIEEGKCCKPKDEPVAWRHRDILNTFSMAKTRINKLTNFTATYQLVIQIFETLSKYSFRPRSVIPVLRFSRAAPNKSFKGYFWKLLGKYI